MRKHWRGDVAAGITVGVVALPLALAFGVSSGVGAAAGVVTAIIAGFVATVFGGSNLQVSGPTGAMVVIIAPLVALHGPGAVPLLSILAGFMVILGGVLGMGRAISLIPWPVIEGFTVGIATIIALQQLPNALGIEASRESNTLIAAVDTVRMAEWPQMAAPLAIATATVLIIIAVTRLLPGWPASLIAVTLATIVVFVAKIDTPLIGALPDSLPAPSLPIANPGLVAELLPGAAAVAILAGIESLLSARVAAGMVKGERYHPDRELVGQGLASVASGLFGGMPATGAMARTAVNIRAGGRTRLSVIIHALFLLAVVYLASGIVSTIPLAALAGVLLVTAFNMISFATAQTILLSTRSDALVFCLTAGTTVVLDLIWAIGVGVAVTGVLVLRHLARQSGVYREDTPDQRRITILRIDGAMFFGVSDRIESQIPEFESVDVVILRLSRVGVMDATGAKALADIAVRLREANNEVFIKGIDASLVALIEEVGVIDTIGGPDHLFTDLDDALAVARAIVREKDEERRLLAAKIEREKHRGPA
ncbi:SulP family inorganic anion transporter [Flaviflexus huanghaiensis]|uniref:SulP family inorganic anion transporter n=1 Tax=Flaviflexus huanghaiensis TaxID=1111473 RepID=UPI0015F7C73B|nr:SulP family inorganic anion transporter [Flaviflexus huanghaiensis]